MQAFIFDMDGVIIDSEPIHTLTKMQVIHDFGLKFNEADCENYMGRTTKDMFTELIEAQNNNIDVNEMTAHKHELYLKTLLSGDIKPIAGIMELFEKLKQRDIKMALASSSRRKVIDIIVERFGLERYFSSIISGGDLPKSKPDPLIYLLSAEKLGVRPAECAVLEDAAAGVLAAKRAGMYVVGYQNPNSGQQDLSLADETVKQIAEINLDKLFMRNDAREERG